MDKHLLDIIDKFINLEISSIKEQQRKCLKNNLTDCQKRYLNVIDSNEPLTSGEFAKLIQVSKPTVSQLINKFSDCGYVTKEVCPTDKRVCYIRLTAEGKQVAEIEKNARIQVIQTIETNLNDEELNQFISLLEKLF